MRGEVLTTFDAETPEAKARWFQSLTMAERARIFSEWHDFALALNPHIAEEKNKHVPQYQGGVCVLRKP